MKFDPLLEQAGSNVTNGGEPITIRFDLQALGELDTIIKTQLLDEDDRAKLRA
jgi:hypothetical protein